MNDTSNRKTATLLLTCPDRKGLVARISGFLFQNGGNILHADQHQDSDNGLFLMRVEWDREGCSLDETNFASLFRPIADELSMTWRITFSEVKPRVAIFVSKFDHCLADLLYRNRMGEFHGEICLVISNHSNARELVEFYRLPFHEIPIHCSAQNQGEKAQMELLRQEKIDLIVLARYMQILSPSFVSTYPNQIINIHHSFLPSFQGAKPYHQAFARGVKVIGATSHYVTQGLDEGPIIHQDVVRISHRDQVGDLIRKGRDLETLALSRAVKLHLENRIVIYGNRTVILE